MKTVLIVFYEKRVPEVKPVGEGSVDEVLYVHPGTEIERNRIGIKDFSIQELVNILSGIDGDRFCYLLSDDLKAARLASVISAIQFVIKPNDEVFVYEGEKLKRIPVVMWGGPVKYISVEEIFFRVCNTPRKWAINGFLRSVLSPNERKVLKEIVLRRATISQIARKFGKSQKTIEHQIRNIYSKARRWYNLPEKTPLDRKFLINSFKEAFIRRKRKESVEKAV